MRRSKFQIKIRTTELVLLFVIVYSLSMSLDRQSDLFKPNFNYWRVFGIWQGRASSKFYKYYSICFLFVTLVIYFILLSINLLCTPLKIEIFVQEVLFYFTEINIIGKVATVLLMRDKIMEAVDLMDSAGFTTEDYQCKQIIRKANANYTLYWKAYEIFAIFSFVAQVVCVPIATVILGSDVGLPVCNYFFLNDDTKTKFFAVIYMYQSIGIYCHMIYNISVDSFVAGATLVAITQFRVLNHNISSLRVREDIPSLTIDEQESMQIVRLHRCLKHYDLIVRYCSVVHSILSRCIFLQFGISSVNMCVGLCGLMMIPSTGSFIFSASFNLIYLGAMVQGIFIPGWLGTVLSYESESLVTAAYSCEWVPRSEPFKRSLRLFMERAKTPVVLTGATMFPLSLDTFISIMKTTYSFFTLLRFVLNKNVGSL